MFSYVVTPDIAYFSGAVLLSFYEFVFYPLLQKTYKVITGNCLWVHVVSQIARVIALMTTDLDLVTCHNYLEHNNGTFVCIFMEKSSIVRSAFDIKWIMLPHLLNTLSMITCTSAISAFEFICSQTPYSMRGLLFGALNGIVVLYSMMGFAQSHQEVGVWVSSVVNIGTCY